MSIFLRGSRRSFSAITRLGTTVSPRLSEAVIHGNTVYVSGQVPSDFDAPIREQVSSTLAKVDRILEEAGSNRNRILVAHLWVKSMATDFDAMNEVWEDWVDASHKPARVCVEANMAKPNILFEAMVTAALEPPPPSSETYSPPSAAAADNQHAPPPTTTATRKLSDASLFPASGGGSAFESDELGTPQHLLKLDQFLKFVEAANNGGHAGALCLAGNVHVNGVAESRRGRKLFAGDEVTVDHMPGIVFDVAQKCASLPKTQPKKDRRARRA